jgi:rod shape determining protein RodA
MFAYVGMVLGFIGCACALLLIFTICTKMLTTASASRDFLGRMICFGAFAVIIVESVVNVGMVLAITPVAGSQLPFISAGGSTTLSLWIAVGLVMSVWAYRKRDYHMFYEED